MSGTWTADLLVGLAEHLDAEGTATWTPGAALTPSTPPPVALGRVPESPDRVITLAVAGAVEPRDGDDALLVQVRTRTTADDSTGHTTMQDAVRQALHHLSGTVGGVTVGLAERLETGDLGDDPAGRAEAVSTWRLETTRPSSRPW